MFALGSYSYFLYHSGEKSAEYGCLEAGTIQTQKANKKTYEHKKVIYDQELPENIDSITAKMNKECSEFGVD